MDLGGAAPVALLHHPSVRTARLIGSRAEGRAHGLSDRDFTVEARHGSALEPQGECQPRP
jgi:hypothetical protein